MGKSKAAETKKLLDAVHRNSDMATASILLALARMAAGSGGEIALTREDVERAAMDLNESTIRMDGDRLIIAVPRVV